MSPGQPGWLQTCLSLEPAESLWGGWWQKWFSAGGVSFMLPLTSMVTSDLNFPGRHAMRKAAESPRIPVDCELGRGWLCLEELHKYAIILSVYPKIPQTNAQ